MPAARERRHADRIGDEQEHVAAFSGVGADHEPRPGVAELVHHAAEVVRRSPAPHAQHATGRQLERGGDRRTAHQAGVPRAPARIRQDEQRLDAEGAAVDRVRDPHEVTVAVAAQHERRPVERKTLHQPDRAVDRPRVGPAEYALEELPQVIRCGRHASLLVVDQHGYASLVWRCASAQRHSSRPSMASPGASSWTIRSRVSATNCWTSFDRRIDPRRARAMPSAIPCS